jgi:phenylacetate-CoA ligase
MNSLLLRHIVFPAYHKLRKTKVMERINELEKSQWKSPEDLAVLQALKLKRLLIHANNTVPFYRERFNDLGIDATKLHQPEYFSKIPLLTKKDINENRDKMISTNLNGNKLISNSTSGSTGEALYLYYDTRSAAYRRATVIRNEQWLGIRLGNHTATLWGSPMDLKKAAALRGRLHGWANNHMFLSSYDMSDKMLADYERKLNNFKPKLLTCYPGPLTVFAEYLLKKNRKIPSIKAIISSAETLYPWQKDIIEKAFCCPVYNRYGCREFGDIAQECANREGLHINYDRFVVEILNENIEPAAEDEIGETIITDLDNYGMPLIRYRIGDMASFKKALCSCGRGLPLLGQVEGRTLDIVRAPNGNRLGGTFWTLLFRSRPGIKAFQVIQERLDEIIVRYVKDGSVANTDFHLFESRIHEKCSANLNIHFIEVSSIPKTASGKTRFVVSKLKDQQ